MFNFANHPEHALYFEDSPRRVRVVFREVTIADSQRVKLLHETGAPALYYFLRPTFVPTSSGLPARVFRVLERRSPLLVHRG